MTPYNNTTLFTIRSARCAHCAVVKSSASELLMVERPLCTHVCVNRYQSIEAFAADLFWMRNWMPHFYAGHLASTYQSYLTYIYIQYICNYVRFYGDPCVLDGTLFTSGRWYKPAHTYKCLPPTGLASCIEYALP